MAMGLEKVLPKPSFQEQIIRRLVLVHQSLLVNDLLPWHVTHHS